VGQAILVARRGEVIALDDGFSFRSRLLHLATVDFWLDYFILSMGGNESSSLVNGSFTALSSVLVADEGHHRSGDGGVMIQGAASSSAPMPGVLVASKDGRSTVAPRLTTCH
jgi:hypothetical protein